MNVFVLFFIIMMVIGVLGWIVWIVVAVWFVKKVAGGLMSELNSLMLELEKMGREIQDQGSQSAISDAEGQQFAAKLLRAAAIMNQLNQQQTRYSQSSQLGAQRYQQRLGALHSVAAQAGIDWSPPPY